MKFFLSIVVFFLFINNSFSKEVEAFCLIKSSDLRNANIAQQDHSRFLGKEIHLLINFGEGDDNYITELSADKEGSEDLGLITGMNSVFDFKEFKLSGSNGIKYESEIIAKDSNKEIKYKYNNFIRIVNDEPTSLHAIVKETGLSFTSFKFQIDCRGKPYSEKEKEDAKNILSEFPSLKKYIEKNNQNNKNNLKNIEEFLKEQQNKKQN